ncbi:hypothetical protein [Ornithinibacillus halotolerans]|uniref:Uncharacterized protein n=1 Tax=Ornithinibacillus halotolerans TaxID=1274357 RepID=A0A916RL96_9BACI|nr:hypothetical protein [Ornithinibacillus halotolerans]GGA60366.1 hypothetical protein GCM10008025_00480 [Ornithinibacillus halotolerans]
MNGLKWVSPLTIIVGIVFIIFGWTQSWDYYADSTVIEEIYLNRTIRTYVFIVGGILLIFIGILFQAVIKYINSLEIRMYQLRRELEEKK